MITLLSEKNTIDFQEMAHTNRILLFLQYKKAEYTHTEVSQEKLKELKTQFNFSSVPVLINTRNNKSEIFENSLHALREIEEEFPHPLGFIGPVESLFQSTSMLIPKTLNTKNSADIRTLFSEIFESIIDKLEYSDFLMGPTFTVADCVLAGDLQAMQHIFSLKLPKELTEYVIRVQNKCK